MDDALLLQALSRIDEEVAAAARDGCAAETYVRLAAPSREDRAAAMVMATMVRRGQGNPLPSVVHEAIERWRR